MAKGVIHDSFTEVLILMHWDKRVCNAMIKAEKEWVKAGSPPIPITETNYRKKFNAK